MTPPVVKIHNFFFPNESFPKFQEKTLESPETVMISLIPPVQAVVSITHYQFGQTFKLDTVDEPTFAEINEANDIINYQSEHQQRCSKDGNITSNLSICLSTGTALVYYLIYAIDNVPLYGLFLVALATTSVFSNFVHKSSKHAYLHQQELSKFIKSQSIMSPNSQPLKILLLTLPCIGSKMLGYLRTYLFFGQKVQKHLFVYGGCPEN